MAVTDDEIRVLLAAHAAQIEQDVARLGAGAYNFMLPETHALKFLINPRERIVGIVYGKYHKQGDEQVGRGALVATTDHIFLVDKKPLFEKIDELSYRAVSGVTYGRVGLIGTVTLHSRLGDIKVRTFNQKCAITFVRAVEAKIFGEPGGEGSYDHAEKKRSI